MKRLIAPTTFKTTSRSAHEMTDGSAPRFQDQREFQRDITPELQIASTIHDAHPTLAGISQDAKTPKQIASIQDHKNLVHRGLNVRDKAGNFVLPTSPLDVGLQERRKSKFPCQK